MPLTCGKDVEVSGYALIVVDMVKDNVNTQGHGMLDGEAGKIIPVILDLSLAFRKAGAHVVFACDSFMASSKGTDHSHGVRCA